MEEDDGLILELDEVLNVCGEDFEEEVLTAITQMGFTIVRSEEEIYFTVKPKKPGKELTKKDFEKMTEDERLQFEESKFQELKSYFENQVWKVSWDIPGS